MTQTKTHDVEVRPSLPEFLDYLGTEGRIPMVSWKKIQGLKIGKLFQYLFGSTSDCFLLESGKGPASIARYSFFGSASGPPLKVHAGDLSSFEATFEIVNFQSNKQKFTYLNHFWGGWVGYFSYESANFFEDLDLKNKSGGAIPEIYLIKTNTVFVYDHIEKILKCIISIPGSRCDSKNYHIALEILYSWWSKIESFQELPEEHPKKILIDENIQIHSNLSREDYRNIVNQAKSYIEEGDIYQANLAQCFQVSYSGEPHTIYDRLQSLNPSPFSGLFKMDQATLISSSPERLVKVEGDLIETRPIAGTRPRGADSCEDNRLSEELLLNQKERAEHLMLVDLERNDLGRICENGTVHVSDFMFREEYSHVHHIVSNVVGKLQSGLGLRDILQAVFPGGTITGCPKIRCMEIIDELEPDPRGPYCGALGYIGFGPYLDLNILIRTILLKGGTAWFHAGAGIVADSIPDKEYEETLNKAAALLLALTGKESFSWD